MQVLVSPCDGKVTFCGPVEAPHTHLTQVKGIAYPLRDLVGHPAPAPDKKGGARLWQCVLYLAPGDYHGFHAPADWTVTMRTHFPGLLLPVASSLVGRVSGIFNSNERVSLEGHWAGGWLAYVAVGAYNVGSIVVKWDKVHAPWPIDGAPRG